MTQARRYFACLLPAVGMTALLTAAVPAAPIQRPRPAIRAVDGPGVRKAIAANRGKVVLLNLWATYCEPCVVEFPSLVKLYNNYKSRGLVVLAVSVDEPKSLGKVEPFLVAQKATFPSFVRKPGDTDAFINAIDRKWTGALPITYIFDRRGKQVGKPITGAGSYQEFAAAVAPLLK